MSTPNRTTHVSPLAKIEFDKASSVIKYGDVMRKVGRAEQAELHTAADELQAVLSRSAVNLWNRAISRRKARRVANILRKAAGHQRSLAVCGVQLSRAFKREYASMIDPPKTTKSKVLNFKE